MTLRSRAILGIAASLLTSSAFAQTNFPEVEPNSQKSEATLASGLVPGDSLSGTTTGLVITLGDTSVGSVDVFRVKTAAQAFGVYRHQLTLTSTTAGATATIRGLLQTTGVITPGSDTSFQASTGGTNVWYGFGKQEEIYYRVQGTASSTAAYTATISSTSITPQVVPGTFNAGTITVSSNILGQTTDTEIYVYDGNLNPVPLGHNDDPFPHTIFGPSIVPVLLPAGTYYVAISNFNTSNDQSDANPVENYQSDSLLDFPNAMANSSTTTALAMSFSISDGTNTATVTATKSSAFEIQWATFTVTGAIPPPANDNCANAIAITGALTSGYVATATQDGSASCDPGGAASRDVWYSYTVPAYAAFGGTFTASTCGTSGADTVLSVHSSCGGAELACSDDCGGTPCGASNSCVTLTTLTAGQTVLLRVSEKGLGGTFVTLNTSFVGNPPPNDHCATPIALPGPGTYGFDTSVATDGEGTTGGCGGAPVKNLWFSYAATTNGTLTITTCGQVNAASGSQDTEIWIYAGAGCPSAASIACNDDDSSCTTGSGLNSTVSTPTTCGTTYMIELGNYTFQTTANIFGTFTITETGTACSTPSTPFCDGSGVGTSCLGCGNNGAAGRGCANSSFASGALLVNGGISSVGADTMTLTGSDMTGPGLFFQATGLAGTPITFGDGMLCAASGILRMGVVFPTAGVATYPGGLTPAPIGSFGATAGATLHYQCWYRDAVAFCTSATFNLTNGLSLTWTP